MPELKLNGKTYSGSTSYASAINYTEEDGSKTTVQDKISELAYRPVNNNILINSNFANPVNQRGQTTKSDSGYWIDRWRKGSNISCSIGNGYVEITRNSQSTSSSFIQPIEVAPLLGKTVTFSVKLYNGSITSVTTTIPFTIPSQYGEIAQTSYIDEMFRLMMALDETGVLQVGVIPYTNKTIRLEWAKLELGEVATPYVPRLYWEEYQLCQRYYQKLYGIYSHVYAYSVDAFTFACPVINIMRAVPTVDVSNCKMYIAGTSKSGYTFTATSRQTYYIQIKSAKTAHGYTLNDCPQLNGYILLDAEL